MVSLGGVDLPYSPISAGANYTLYGADISAFAGQLEQLMFTALPGGNNYWTLDDIQFSTQLVPEPGVFGLAALGALFLGWRVRRRR
ncbi:MAG: PEP-CTERM sorting domain-containing protein [Verrucomicrobia bacterium]|nr:PEP-CTERM sorting domain-containing protein [Verrucomicrobiota bacterium]